MGSPQDVLKSEVLQSAIENNLGTHDPVQSVLLESIFVICVFLKKWAISHSVEFCKTANFICTTYHMLDVF